MYVCVDVSAGMIWSLGESSLIWMKRILRKENGEWLMITSLALSYTCYVGSYILSLVWLVLFHSREERRWLEKQNKAARQKRKKEELSRLRTLVGIDMLIGWCFSCHGNNDSGPVYRQCICVWPSSEAFQGPSKGRERDREEGEGWGCQERGWA